MLGPKTVIAPIETDDAIETPSNYIHSHQLFAWRGTTPADSRFELSIQYSLQTGETIDVSGVAYPVTDSAGYPQRTIWSGKLFDLRDQLLAAVAQEKLTLEEVVAELAAIVEWDAQFSVIADGLAELLNKSGICPIPERQVRIELK